jgi:hypothetical protein
LLDFLAEVARIIPHPLLRFAVVAEGLLAIVMILALPIGVPLQHLAWFSISLLILFLPTLVIVYVDARRKQIDLQEVRAEKNELEAQEQFREEVKALFARFWQIRDGEPLFCAISTLGHRQTWSYKRPMTGFGEIRGYASVVYSLARAYETNVTKDARLYFSDSLPMNVQLESSWILLGGDDRNYVTNEMFKQFRLMKCELPFRFVYETEENLIKTITAKIMELLGFKSFAYKSMKYRETGIKYLICENEKNKKKYEPVMREDRVIEDFGVVARLPNPLNRDYSRLFIFAGCHTYGTAAAAKVVAARAILEQIEESCPSYRKSKFFVAIIHANVIGYTFFHVDRMEVFYPLDEDLKPIPGGIVRNVRFHLTIRVNRW